MKKNIPLFYSILISLIVLAGGSFASYQVLQEKKSAIKEKILARAESLFYTLEESIKNEDRIAIDSRIENFRNEIKQSESLLQVSLILLPEFYYYASTQKKLIDTDVLDNLKEFFQNSKTSNPIQRVVNEDGLEATFQFVVNVKSVLNNQKWIVHTVFDVAPFDKELNDLKLMLITIQLAILTITFATVYALSSILSRNLNLLSYALGNILSNKSEIKKGNSFVEISNVCGKLEKIKKIFNQQKEIIQKLEEEIKNPLKQGLMESKSLEKKNYLSLLMQLNYSVFKNTDTTLSLKDFLIFSNFPQTLLISTKEFPFLISDLLLKILPKA